jgi:hypothetical protein
MALPVRSFRSAPPSPSEAPNIRCSCNITLCDFSRSDPIVYSNDKSYTQTSSGVQRIDNLLTSLGMKGWHAKQ